MGDDFEEIQETNSGVKKEGNWKEISEFGKDVEEAMDGVAEEQSVEKFDEWRPKVEEAESDVKRKTVDEAVLNENRLEKESNGVKEDLKDASGKVAEAGKKAAQKENPEGEVVAASEEAARPFYSKLAQFFRKMEGLIYDKISLRFNPYYLDTNDFSVDIKDKKKGEFEMDIAVPKKETRRKLKENLKDN